MKKALSFFLVNGLSFLRIPLAFFLLKENPYLRFLAILLALLTDIFDGYLARKMKATSSLGSFLDPFTDKFFVYFALAIFYSAQQIPLWAIFALVSRDIVQVIFGFYLFLCQKWKVYTFFPTRWGKVATFLQFFFLALLTFHLPLPFSVFLFFIPLSFFTFYELWKRLTIQEV